MVSNLIFVHFYANSRGGKPTFRVTLLESKKIVCIVTDNASNFVKTSKYFGVQNLYEYLRDQTEVIKVNIDLPDKIGEYSNPEQVFPEVANLDGDGNEIGEADFSLDGQCYCLVCCSSLIIKLILFNTVLIFIPQVSRNYLLIFDVVLIKIQNRRRGKFRTSPQTKKSSKKIRFIQ